MSNIPSNLLNNLNSNHVLTDFADSKYRNEQGLSQSDLKYFVSQTPLHYKNRDKLRFESEALDIGTATHLAVLQPHLFYSYVAIVPKDAPKRPSSIQLNAKKPSEDTIAAIKWWDEFNAASEGKLVLSKSDVESVMRMRDSVLENNFVRNLLDTPFFDQDFANSSEVSVFRGYPNNVMLKGRVDYLSKAGIFDLKTINKIPTEHNVRKRIWESRYDIQQVQYQYLLSPSYGKTPKMFFGFIEKQEPFSFCVYEISEDDIELATKEWHNAILKYEDCLMRNDYQAFPNNQSIKINLRRNNGS